MYRSRAQQQAAFARMAQASHARFPLRGKTERAKRNRALSLAVGGGTVGTGLVLATGAGARTGPLRALLGTSGYRHGWTTGPGGEIGSEFRTFHTGSRPATATERALLEVNQKLGLGGRPLRRAMGATSWRPSRAGARVWEVSGTPIDARLRAAGRRLLERRVERATLWNVLGKGELLHTIERASLGGQDAARGVTRRLLTKAAEHIERPVVRTVRRHVEGSVVLANRRLARLARQLGRGLVRRAA